MSSPTIPQWLAKSRDSSHIQFALRTLKLREDSRTRAAYASIPHKTGSFRAVLQNISKSTSEFYSITAGHDDLNQRRNRYIDVVPYDRTRVVVNDQGCCGTSSSGSYLNADWVLERFGGKWWIASQAPLPNTSHTFLSLISKPVSPPLLSGSSDHKSRVRTVVQLTQNVEEGRRKAHPYFPDSVGHRIVVPPEDDSLGPLFEVALLEHEVIDDACCICSTVSFTPLSPPNAAPIMFKHLLYHAWPDRGVPNPENRAGLLAFAKLVDKTNRQETDPDDPDPPMIVGCSAGIGRTGSFIALCSLLRSHGILQPPAKATSVDDALPPSPLGDLPDSLKEDEVVREVDSLREQRPGMVQRPEQLLVIYEILMSTLTMRS
ncbi:phosphatases II [Marasmius fiardii PR-910]|nr:phosphatases II [Marasmius fiardii PR-910]